jgi:hypothetical protein
MTDARKGPKRIVWILSIGVMATVWIFFFSSGDLSLGPFNNVALNSMLVIVMGLSAFGLIWFIWFLLRWVVRGFSGTEMNNELIKFTVKVLISAIIFGITMAIVMKSVEVKTEYQGRGGRGGR